MNAISNLNFSFGLQNSTKIDNDLQKRSDFFANNNLSTAQAQDTVEISSVAQALQTELRKIKEAGKVESVVEDVSKEAKRKVEQYEEIGKSVERAQGAEDLDDFEWGTMVSLAETIGVSTDRIMEITFDDLEDYHHEFVIKPKDYIQNAAKGVNITSFNSAKEFWDAKFREKDGLGEFEMIKVQSLFNERGMVQSADNKKEYDNVIARATAANGRSFISNSTAIDDVPSEILMLFNEALQEEDDAKMGLLFEYVQLVGSVPGISGLMETKGHARNVDELMWYLNNNRNVHGDDPYGQGILFAGKSLADGMKIYKTGVAGFTNTWLGEKDRIM
ncbi:MAG: hypothetical protein LBV09_05445 [Deferribacteraceae bacterium]|jgi:hypothetical protein|nr:hypothetical protein [Deferribacteraceae bacterium]